MMAVWFLRQQNFSSENSVPAGIKPPGHVQGTLGLVGYMDVYVSYIIISRYHFSRPSHLYVICTANNVWSMGNWHNGYYLCHLYYTNHDDHVIYGKLASWIGYASLIRMNSQEKLEIIYTESNCPAHHHHFCFYDQRGLFQSSCIDGWKNKTRNLM